MADYIFLMRDPEGDTGPLLPWGPYIEGLIAKGVMRGGSAVGDGICVHKDGSQSAPSITSYIRGYIKVEADSLEVATALLAGNPVYEAGGVIEIRELPVTD